MLLEDARAVAKTALRYASRDGTHGLDIKTQYRFHGIFYFSAETARVAADRAAHGSKR